MTEQDAPPVAEEEKKHRKPRKPSLKDWVRVIKSQGNALPNTTVHLVVNEATGLVELVTNAPAAEGSDEMEGQRTQVFHVTSFETVNDPDRNPLETKGEEPNGDGTAPPEGEAPPEGGPEE